MSQPDYNRMSAGDSTADPTLTARILHARRSLSSERELSAPPEVESFIGELREGVAVVGQESAHRACATRGPSAQAQTAGRRPRTRQARNRPALTGVTQPTVIDALACKMGLTLDGNLQLPNNVVVLAKGFELQGILSAAGSTNLKLWLVTPGDFDTTGIGNGTCNGDADGKLAHSSIGPIVWNGNVSAMLYTPCKITVGEGASWRGQLYGGSVDTLKDSALEYEYVGLPGDGNFNSGDGGASGSEAGGAKTGLGRQVSVRDRNTK